MGDDKKPFWRALLPHVAWKGIRYFLALSLCWPIHTFAQSQKKADCKAGDIECVKKYVLGPNQRLMSVTALEYHEAKDKPYVVEGKTTAPPVLYYKLACKRGGASLKAGESYRVTETRDEDNLKVLMIDVSLPDEPDVIAIECEVVSVRIAAKPAKKTH